LSDARKDFWRAAAGLGGLVGLLLAIAGLAVRNVVETVGWTSGACAAPVILGLALMAAGVAANRGRLREMLARRTARALLNIWAGALLAFVLMVLVNAISAGSHRTAGWSLDLTASGLHTLAPQTVNILGGLERPVKITVFLGEGQAGDVPVGEEIKELARLYAARSDRVTAEIIDVYLDNTRARQAALELNVEPRPDSVVVSSGEHRVPMPFSELVEAGGSAFQGEEKFSSSVLSVIEEKQPVVYFLAGHGEAPIRGGGAEALNEFVAELKRGNYRVESLDLFAEKAAPEDASLLVIAGPKSPFQEEEVELLRAWLNGGGRLLVFALPLAAKGDLKGLDALLDEYNVSVRSREVAIEVYRELVSGREIGNINVIVRKFGAHPITQGLETMNVVLREASPVNPVRPEEMPLPGRTPVRTTPYRTTPLLFTSPAGWGETNLEAPRIQFDENEDSKGPLSLAAAVRLRPPETAGAAGAAERNGPRLVVIGSPTIASDGELKQYAGNRAFLMNAVNWLTEREARLGIPPRRGERRELTASPSAMKAVFFIAVIAMPLAVLLCGAAVRFFRGRA
jgi:hypothetical protein